MKAPLTSAILMLICSSSSTLASTGTAGEGVGLMTMLFVGFFAMIIAAQLAPGALLFCSGLKGLFGKGQNDSVANR